MRHIVISYHYIYIVPTCSRRVIYRD